VSRAGLVAAIVMLASLSACGGPSTAPPAPPATPTAPATAAPPLTSSPAVTSVDRRAPPGFADLSDVDPTILLDIRYHTDHNFVGRPIDGYLEPRCLLTAQAAQALHRAQTAARAKGYNLKVYDCYRPMRAGEDFVAWARRPGDQTTKAEFYPNLAKDELFAEGYVGGARTSHSRGTAVDLTLVPLPSPAQRPYRKGEPLTSCTAPAHQRFPDNTVDMGTGYDCFDARSHTLNPAVTGAQRDHRLLLRQLMTGAGFVNYANEWWHYDLAKPTNPHAYYDFPVARAALR
jgi:D-alanyl-D-alanine dipeptidase